MEVELKLFNELIDTFGKVVNGLKTIVNMPRAERERYRDVLSETFRLIDTTLNMVIIRLGDVGRVQDDTMFLREAGGLDNSADWVKAERAFRLCESLRVAVREAESLPVKAIGVVSANDWKGLLQTMREIAGAEWTIADYISTQLGTLTVAARSSAAGNTAQIRTDVDAVRQMLIGERKKLLKQEVELYSIV
jgi:hypothetical protein